MTVNLQMFAPFMKNWVCSNMEITLVITIKDRELRTSDVKVMEQEYHHRVYLNHDINEML
ncbi:hypothetical protein MTR_7g056507 [Medicago truncatula]|uniref:Uncharacterized protein n=1 Tax=Medicago truncatula TaxID=3880 RepID=A0A072U0M4_MEDTR|nr:hypothetical protein MTR_7g056507 [Medicago truncatula]